MSQLPFCPLQTPVLCPALPGLSCAPWLPVLSLCSAVLRWLPALHQVMHRDMKLENVLLTSNRASTATAKLADFGLARRMHGSGKAGRAKRERL